MSRSSARTDIGKAAGPVTAARPQGTDAEDRTVYSTDSGRIYPARSEPVPKSAGRSRVVTPAGRGPVRVGKETKGRRGKGVTVITGISLPPPELLELGAQLKRICGAGGTVKDGVIEIQGEHRDALVEELKKLGYAAKRSGG